MSTHTHEKTIAESIAPEIQTAEQDVKLHKGPVARLLAEVSRAAEEYADYKLSKCDWRRFVI